MTSLHPCRLLWQEQYRTAVYGANMVPVPEPIPGRAFFPGGFGLEAARKGHPLPPFPFRGVMVVGQDFQTLDNYRLRLAEGWESDDDGTWPPLLALLRAAYIDPTDAFFTNAYLGLRSSHHQTGRNPDRRHGPYVECCQAFLLRQLELQRPRVVLTLGSEPLMVLARLSPELADLRRQQSFAQIDGSSGGPVRYGVTFEGIRGWATRLVALVHPSFRNSNVHRRRFSGDKGHDAELAMLAAEQEAAR
jgi:uracil-DNA glycosylase